MNRPHPAVLTLLLAAGALGAPPARAQDRGAELDLFALDATLARETTVASGRARTIRETPGVVTLFEREDLLASGARDLADLLTRVPGFQLGGDVENSIAPGFRGIWGQEGKILFVIDGFEMNELSYGGFQLGNRVLLDQLERVEIIRGPGSVIYGGNAELAVVNVITRAAAVSGAGVSAGAGKLNGGTSAAYLAAAAGGALGEARAGLSGFIGTGMRSDRPYTDVYGDSFEMSDASRLAPAQLTGAATLGGLTLRAIYSEHATSMRDGYDTVSPREVDVRWRTAAAAASFAWKPSERLTVTPSLTYRWEVPWQAKTPDLVDYYYDVTNQRVTGKLVASFAPTSQISLLAGGEAYWEQGRVNQFDNGLLSFAGERTVEQYDVAGYAELGADTRFANVLLGGRFEHHERFGDSFVPRLALTRLFAPFHVKLLASGAFRTPSFENANYGVDITPERTRVFEAEVGWQASRALYLSANVFDLTIEDPIVFGFTGSDVYTNEARTGSRGVEAEGRVQAGAVSAQLSWSFYSPRGKNDVPAYEIPDHSGLLAGFAGHKVVAAAQIRPLSRLVVSPTIVFLSERYARDRLDGAGELAVGRTAPALYLDLFAAWRDLGVRGLELGVGLRNLLDTDVVYLQPYPGGHAPLPGAGREVTVRLRFERG